MQSVQCNSALDGLSAADKLRFSQFGFAPTVHPPFQCVHHAFQFHAGNNPNSIAVQDSTLR